MGGENEKRERTHATRRIKAMSRRVSLSSVCHAKVRFGRQRSNVFPYCWYSLFTKAVATDRSGSHVKIQSIRSYENKEQEIMICLLGYLWRHTHDWTFVFVCV